MVSMEEFIVMNMTDDEDSESDDDSNQPRERVSHEKAFASSNAKFKNTYRLTKPLVRQLIEELKPLLTAPNRASDLSVEIKILSALNFFAKGSYQAGIGDNKNASISQASVSKSLTEVVGALNHPNIFGKYVKFPQNYSEMNAIAKKFYQLYGLPVVIGCIDCTHVAIYPPPNNETYDERSYVNRKGYHSINTQLICDADLNILNVNALFPGSTHDSYVWNQSLVKSLMERIHEQGEASYYLIGDSGYPLRRYLQVPIADPAQGPEQRYNNKFKSARATIERCNGVLKGRFRCLLKHRVLHYSPEKASKIINSCVVLHNMCTKNNIALDSDSDSDSEGEVDLESEI